MQSPALASNRAQAWLRRLVVVAAKAAKVAACWEI
jgi:hypothetical protein